jgi:hypothetical protein
MLFYLDSFFSFFFAVVVVVVCFSPPDLIGRDFAGDKHTKICALKNIVATDINFIQGQHCDHMIMFAKKFLSGI